MLKKWKYAIGITTVVIAGIGMAEVVMNCGSIPQIFTISSEATTRLEAAHSLCGQEVVAVSVGPFFVVATPFHLAYSILSIGLAFFALLVCLTHRLFLPHTRPFHLHPPKISVATAKWIKW